MYALVDTGALYSWIPGRILRELGLEPTDQIEFVMANGKVETREMTEAVVRLSGQVRHTIFVFGEGTDQVLLGAYTLEGFGLAVDTRNKRLVPMPVVPAAKTNG